MTSVRLSQWVRAFKAPPASSKARYRPASRTDAASQFPLSYDDFGILAALSDVCAIVVASMATGSAYHWLAYGRVGSVAEFFGVGVILAALTAALMKLKELYTPDRLLSVRSQVSPTILVWSSVILFLLGVSFTLKISEGLSRGAILLLAITAPWLILGQRLLVKRAMLAILQKGWLKRSKIALITRESNDTTVSDEALRAYDVVGVYVLPSDSEGTRRVLANLVGAARGANRISEVHLAMDWNRWSDMKQVLAELRVLPLPVRLIADAPAREILQHPQRSLSGVVSVELQRPPLTVGERAAKRAFDIAGATIGLLAIAPLLLIIAFAVWIDSPGPVLFRQRRGGFNGRAFKILKFRTMRVMEDGPTIIQATPNDHRLTRIGRGLRRFSADELPQLINVLRGDMSLVGPRPHALAHDLQYGRLISNYPYRHHVRPGMTGWAQVNGFRGETPTVDKMKQRVELDLWYATNWSFWLDLRILLWTLLEVCRTRNAF
jgi:putative colanic acid biosynthesis UDP-glucose lipid carrier transferase